MIDLLKLRTGLSVIARRGFKNGFSVKSFLTKSANRIGQRKLGIDVWDFNGIGL